MPKKIVRLNEARLRQMVTEAVRRIVNEGAYGYPDTVDGIILCSENDRELYDEYTQIAKAVAKVYKRDAKITAERLIDSSIMKRYQQHCFGKYGKENPDKDRIKSPRIFREYVANKIIDEVLNGQWDERKKMNEAFGKEKYNKFAWNGNGFDEGYWLTAVVPFGGLNNDFIKTHIGYVNDTKKTVSAMHGFYYPNNLSLSMMKYAMKLGYRYEDPEMPAKINKTLSSKKLNEYYTDDPNDGYDYEEGKPYYSGVYGYYSVKPEGIPTEVDYAQNTRNHKTMWTKKELDNRNKMMNKYIKGKRDEDDIDDAWYGIHMNESQQPDGSYGYQNVPDEFVESLGENGYDVIVPDYCLPYLVNGDMEGYEEDEIQEMQEFEKRFQGKLKNGLTAGDCCIPRDGESPSLYGRNDVFKGDMGSECYRFFLPAAD